MITPAQFGGDPARLDRPECELTNSQLHSPDEAHDTATQMMSTIGKVLRLGCALTLFNTFSLPAQADLDDAIAAYQTGDHTTVLKEFIGSAVQGDAAAQYNLGLMYDKGEGVPLDEAEALQWYLLAAEQGHAKAQSNLGNLYEHGLGVQQNYFEAVKWYRKSAERGDPSGQIFLASMYAKGQGVPQDFVHALIWVNLATAQLGAGPRDAAAEMRDIVAGSLTREQITEAQRRASEWTPCGQPPENRPCP